MALIAFGNVMAIADTVGNVSSVSAASAMVEFVANTRGQLNYVNRRNIQDDPKVVTNLANLITISAADYVTTARGPGIYVNTRNILDINTGISRNRPDTPKSERWT